MPLEIKNETSVPPNSQTPNTSKMSLDIGTLLKLIPTFDTDQHQQVYRFIRSCDSAFKLATQDQRPVLLVYALNNITGSGAPDVHSKQHCNWDDLKPFLIEKFSNVKTISHLNLELQSMFQKSNESLTEYYHRVDLCRSKIVEKLNAEITDNSLIGRLATTEETALSVFINGISSDIGAMLRTKGFTTLYEAGRFAMQEDKIRAMNNARQMLFKTSIPKPQTSLAPRPQRPPFQPYRNRFATPTYAQTSNQTQITSPKFCNYCKNPGHLISECRKRAYNNNRSINQPASALPAPPPNQPLRALPAPPQANQPNPRINHLNSQAAEETGIYSETASVPYSNAQIQTWTPVTTQNLYATLENLQL